MKVNAILLDEKTDDLSINIVRDASGKIISGLTLGNTDYQNIRLIVLANKGEFKENPVLGVGAERYLKSVGREAELRREISVQLDIIGYSNADVSVTANGELEINV